MAGSVDEPDGIVGGDGVEIGGGDVAVFGELALVPAGAGDPFARFDESDLGLYTGNDFSHRSGIGELDAVEFLDTSFGDVGVGVDQAWGGGMTVEVDDAGAASVPGVMDPLIASSCELYAPLMVFTCRALSSLILWLAPQVSPFQPVRVTMP